MNTMFYRKYLAFFDAIHPWMTCCCITWWLDRLFVEFGHRTSESEICFHSDLQYVRLHLAFTFVAVVLQTISTTKQRLKQIRREWTLLGVEKGRCYIIYISIAQFFLCICWTGVLISIVDFSPWLCIASLAHRRATVALCSSVSVFVVFSLDAILYDWLLKRQLPSSPLLI